MIIDLTAEFGLPSGMRLVATAISAGTSRRQAETEAVGRLVRHLFGPEARLAHRTDGSPVIERNHTEISVSHTKTHAFMATHPCLRIGIDAEQPRRQLISVAGKFLSPSESGRFATLDRLLTAWTIKEAVYKAAGTPGMALASINIDSCDSTPSMASIPDGRRFRLFTIRIPGHTVTLALPE